MVRCQVAISIGQTPLSQKVWLGVALILSVRALQPRHLEHVIQERCLTCISRIRGERIDLMAMPTGPIGMWVASDHSWFNFGPKFLEMERPLCFSSMAVLALIART